MLLEVKKYIALFQIVRLIAQGLTPMAHALLAGFGPPRNFIWPATFYIWPATS